MKWLERHLMINKFSEVVFDYKGQVSFGRIGALLCLLFSMSMSVAGFFYVTNDKMLSYCSTIALQFLGSAIALYIPSKAAEAASKKWAPEISETIVRSAPVAKVQVPETTINEPEPTSKAFDE